MAVVVPTSRHSTMAMTIKDSLNFSCSVSVFVFFYFHFISFHFFWHLLVDRGLCSCCCCVFCISCFFFVVSRFSVCLFVWSRGIEKQPTTSQSIVSHYKRVLAVVFGEVVQILLLFGPYVSKSDTLNGRASFTHWTHFTHCSTLELGCYRKLNWPLI